MKTRSEGGQWDTWLKWIITNARVSIDRARWKMKKKTGGAGFMNKIEQNPKARDAGPWVSIEDRKE